MRERIIDSNIDHLKRIHLFSGIDLSYVKLTSSATHFHHEALDSILEINYCYKGRLGWKLTSGNSIYLGPGDFSIHTMQSCASSIITLPNDYYEGLTLFIDLNELKNNPPQLLEDFKNIDFYDKFCKEKEFSSFTSNSKIISIFNDFFNKDSQFQLAYQRIKTIELLLYLIELDPTNSKNLTEYQSEQIELIREIHHFLIDNLDQRITIESLSKQFLINPTSLKTLFKDVYGTSIANHIKEHRLEKAAILLNTTSKSIGDIAYEVGYDSPSKFSTAFKDKYHVLPSKYRKSKHK